MASGRGSGADPSIGLRAQGVTCHTQALSRESSREGMRGRWPSPPISFLETGEMWGWSSPQPLVTPCTTGIPKVPISLRHKRLVPL